MYDSAVKQLKRKIILSGELICENPEEVIFFKIYPISKDSINGYKRNTLPVSSCECQFVRHLAKYLDGYEDDYDLIYKDEKTKVVVSAVTMDGLEEYLKTLPIKNERLSYQLFSESPLLNLDREFLHEEGISDSMNYLFE